jgi:hypothetical protein
MVCEENDFTACRRMRPDTGSPGPYVLAMSSMSRARRRYRLRATSWRRELEAGAGGGSWRRELEAGAGGGSWSPDASDEIGASHAEAFGDAEPAATMVVVAGLLDPLWLVEIEVEAIVRE